MHRGSIFLVAFGLIFAVASAAFGWSFFGDEVSRGWLVRSWVEAPATLVEVSGHRNGVGAKYTYRYAGRDYEGSRIGFYDHVYGPATRELHLTNYRRLRAALDAAGPVRTVRHEEATGLHVLRPVSGGKGAPITIRLDPRNPAEAVIDPTIRWESIHTSAAIVGALLFGGLLFAGIGFSMRGASPEASAVAMRVKKPIHGSSHRFPTTGWLFALVWSAFVAIIGSGFRPVAGHETLANLALLAFVAVALYLLWRAILSTLRWRRYRAITLVLDPYPGEVGGVVAGSLVVPVRYEAANRFRVTLSCTEHGIPGGDLSTRNRPYARKLLSEQGFAEVGLVRGGTRLSFRFEVPPEAPASDGYLESISWTSSTAQRIFVRWQLELAADVEGVDLEEEFEIPVSVASDPRGLRVGMPTGTVAPAADAVSSTRPVPLVGRVPESAITSTADASIWSAGSAPSAPTLVHDGVASRPLVIGNPAYTYQRIGNQIRVIQPAWKKPGKIGSFWSVVGAIAVCAVFSAIGWLALSEGNWVVGIVFSLIGDAFIVTILGYLAHELRVDIDDSGIAIERRILGLRLWHRKLRRHDIAAIEALAEASEGAMDLMRSVKVRMLNGNRHTIAELVPNEHEVVALQKLVAARLAVGTAGSATVAARTVLPPKAPKDATSIWVQAAGVVLILAFFGYQAWPFVKAHLGFSDTPVTHQGNAPVTTAPNQSGDRVAASSAPKRDEPALVDDDWNGRFRKAQVAWIEQRSAEALDHYREALAIIERTRGLQDPLTAAMLERIGDVHTKQKNYAEAELALRRALLILDRHSHAEIKAEAGKLIFGFDRESVLRKLGWALWELRRYPESLAIYQRAYDTVAELELEEEARNFRLAYSSAGIMVGACMQQQWERADRAMAELKERMGRLTEIDRRWLDYWVRTGEPRLAARKC